MINVMLVCNAGMSTAMLAQKINKNCDGYCYVEAFGEGEYMEHIENIDVILVGPQIRHLIPSIKKTTQNKIPVSYINPMDYGMMRVDNVISQIKEMLEG
ncbi:MULTISPECIES: PTS sugar transporter subunit IIB [Holdemanella]|jgi:PTS system cellobiose-specific IIB component|uniref:PTS system, Lactose/Cellobiose specific IIB subunit n=2 Tax=Holdemanella biformis TaxID=1735 RepID=B7CCL0_9FIRM|nr:PTS sugar transporter subunit IIB [Holdemanella biformis]MBN2919368.1 PTS sugar transporter subunit IIB [Lactobacillus sp.]MCF7626229.1 PTS sugar transporter subunit IIB [Holdemanella sp. SCCA2]EEC89522.1 PTS system, Lactose/Cellobiose specific IIB subunit [Holdemanella biformis DSM 3989]MBS6233766.1 PTS sugar transporter subunit IIB [Holdemanella biformis]MBS6455371.1 PTS sugar transporter subunit IIB [Holdemanella biformis]